MQSQRILWIELDPGAHGEMEIISNALANNKTESQEMKYFRSYLDDNDRIMYQQISPKSSSNNKKINQAIISINV